MLFGEDDDKMTPHFLTNKNAKLCPLRTAGQSEGQSCGGGHLSAEMPKCSNKNYLASSTSNDCNFNNACPGELYGFSWVAVS